MTSPITITSKPASHLTSAEIADCYSLISPAGILVPPGMIETVHLVHNPTVLLAHQQGRLVGFQTYSCYQVQTPFRARKLTLIYGGLALQDIQAAGQGIAYRMARRYMRDILGPFWPLRNYAILVGTFNPRLIQLLGMQHRLYLPTDPGLTPSVIEFVKEFVRQKRANSHPINDQLVMTPVTPTKFRNEITHQWPRLYRASEDRYNQLAYHLKLIEQTDGRHYLVGKALLVLARSSRSRLVKSSWTLTRKWLDKRLRLTQPSAC